MEGAAQQLSLKRSRGSHCCLKKQVSLLLSKAHHAIRAADILIREGEIEGAAGRAYYAMFYVASALLAQNGLGSAKHSGIHALFGEYFAKPGHVDPKFHRFLLNGFDLRLQADYNFEAVITIEEAATMLDQAREFLAHIEKMFTEP